MASITPHGKGWRAQIRRKGQKALSATFPLKKQAQAWAAQRESEIVSGRLGILPKHTLGEALKRFREKVSPKRPGYRWEKVRLLQLERDPIARISLAVLDESHLADWRDRELARIYRGKPIQGTTVRRVIALLSAVFDVAVREWRWLARSPLKDVRKPPPKKGRARGLRAWEISAVAQELGFNEGRPATAAQQTAIAFLLAVETAMRSGEILSIGWDQVFPKHVHLEKTKNGDERDVPLSPRARELLGYMKGVDPARVFTVASGNRDQLFRDARVRAGGAGFTFHDSRSEAISRLSKKLDIRELAKMTGHRDLKSLMIYYTDDPGTVADKL